MTLVLRPEIRLKSLAKKEVKQKNGLSKVRQQIFDMVTF